MLREKSARDVVLDDFHGDIIFYDAVNAPNGIDPERFQNGKDGPCHQPAFRKRFWTDVLRSLELSFDLIADEARAFNQGRLRFMPDEYISDLEARITALRAEL